MSINPYRARGTVLGIERRKFFNTQLTASRVNDPAFNDSLIEYWTGHSLGAVRGAYKAPSVEDQLRLYQMAEPRLEPIYDG